jgi:FkbM family methyltransferase
MFSNIKKLIKKSPLYPLLFVVVYTKEKIRMRFRPRSFSEFGEDIRIAEILGTVSTFIDIGANDGYHSSNSFYWGLRGARGVCFEPMPEAYRRLRFLYALSWRVVCKNVGISEVSRGTTMISLEDQSFIPETQDQDHRALYKERHDQAKVRCPVELLRFEDAIDGLGMPESIDLLSVDVEGHELSVLRSIPFDTYNFRAIILETHHMDQEGNLIWKHRDAGQIECLLKSYGYSSCCRTRSNTLYVGKT